MSYAHLHSTAVKILYGLHQPDRMVPIHYIGPVHHANSMWILSARTMGMWRSGSLPSLVQSITLPAEVLLHFFAVTSYHFLLPLLPSVLDFG